MFNLCYIADLNRSLFISCVTLFVNFAFYSSIAVFVVIVGVTGGGDGDGTRYSFIYHFAVVSVEIRLMLQF